MGHGKTKEAKETQEAKEQATEGESSSVRAGIEAPVRGALDVACFVFPPLAGDAGKESLIVGMGCNGAIGLADSLPCPAAQVAATGLDPDAFVLAGDVALRATTDLGAVVWLVRIGSLSLGLRATVCFNKSNIGTSISRSDCDCGSSCVYWT